jgi:hypothetical protein
VNLGDLRTYVWRQTDTNSIDLPEATIDSYIEEAFNRTIAAENQWPFYEQQWSVIVPANALTVPTPSDLNRTSLMSVMTVANGFRLEQITQEEAETRFGPGTRWTIPSPRWYSLWGDSLALWPPITSSEPRELRLRGYRQPISAVHPVTGEIDADPRLHRPLAHYAIALAYAQQEDETLEGTYMERWQRDVEMARQAIMDAPRHQPLVMHGNFPRRTGAFGAMPSWPPGIVALPPGAP